VIFTILRHTVGWIVCHFMGFEYEKPKTWNKPALILANHNANIDPALVGLGIGRQAYFLATETVVRSGFGSKVLNFIFAPIPFSKTMADVNAIKEMLRRLRAGANVCLFAEGDRSFNGLTGPISLSTAKLAKKSGVDLVTYRLEGLYFVTPRWAKNKRKGRVKGVVANIYKAEELKSMSVAEIHAAIEIDLFEDAYNRQRENPVLYIGKDLAENIETVLYLCPQCHSFGTIKSSGNTFRCTCGLSGVYTEMCFLESENDEPLQFSTITDWDMWQTGMLPELIKNAGDDAICSDDNQELYKIDPAVGSTFIGKGSMSMSKNEFHCAGKIYPLESVEKIAIFGRQILLFSLVDGTTYEVHSKHVRSALKYREIFRVLTST